MSKKVRHVALCGIMLSLSVGISAIENLIPMPLGVKPGFSNLPVMYGMSEISSRYGFAICIMKSFFVIITRGFTAFFMSIFGGILSYLIMLFIYKKTNATMMLMSVIGALCHNLGQLFAASIILKSLSVFGYSPVLIISGCITGCITGTVLKILINSIPKFDKQGGRK